MNKLEKLKVVILEGASDSSISFTDLCNLLGDLGFEERKSSSHHVFRKAGIIEQPNLQRDGNKAKAYQVRQVRKILKKYEL